MIAKPDLSRYRKCPGCGTWQVKLAPCPKCGTCTYIEPEEEKKVIIPHDQYVQETITRENSVYVRRILELIKDGEWYPKSDVLRALGAYSKSSKRLKAIWEELQEHVDVRTITPRPLFGAWIWIRLKESDDNGKN